MKEASGVNVPDVALEDIALFFWKFSSFFDLKCISEVLVLIIYLHISKKKMFCQVGGCEGMKRKISM